MKRLAACLILLTFAATLSLAADINGRWMREYDQRMFHFERTGSRLTGWWTEDVRCNLSGEIDGDKVNFTATCGRQTGWFHGTIDGYKLELWYRWEGQQAGDRAFTLVQIRP
jgi:hypothetical protein